MKIRLNPVGKKKKKKIQSRWIKETQLKTQINLVNNRFAEIIGSSGSRLEADCIHIHLLGLEKDCHVCLDKITMH